MKENKGRPGAMLYFEIIPALDFLNDAEAGRFMKGVLHYARDDTEPDFSDSQSLSMIWSLVRERLDRDNERYISISLNNSLKRKYSAYKEKRIQKGEEYLTFAEWKDAVTLNSGQQ